jgi:hypothetical protein
LYGWAVTIGSRLRVVRLVGFGLTRYSPRTVQLPVAAVPAVAPRAPPEVPARVVTSAAIARTTTSFDQARRNEPLLHRV